MGANILLCKTDDWVWTSERGRKEAGMRHKQQIEQKDGRDDIIVSDSTRDLVIIKTFLADIKVGQCDAARDANK